MPIKLLLWPPGTQGSQRHRRGHCAPRDGVSTAEGTKADVSDLQDEGLDEETQDELLGKH